MPVPVQHENIAPPARHEYKIGEKKQEPDGRFANLPLRRAFRSLLKRTQLFRGVLGREARPNAAEIRDSAPPHCARLEAHCRLKHSVMRVNRIKLAIQAGRHAFLAGRSQKALRGGQQSDETGVVGGRA